MLLLIAFMSQITIFNVPLPARVSPAPQNAAGMAFGAIVTPAPKPFPPSKPGKSRFNAPTKPPPATAKSPRFSSWVNYYVDLIGSKLERLNALQFDLTPVNQLTQAALMTQELGSLADALNVGTNQFPTNPTQLQWPLSGHYTI